MPIQTDHSVIARPGGVTVTAVTPDRPGSGNAHVELSCGHDFRVAAVQPTYSAGDAYYCSRCAMDQWEREHPGLSDDQIAAIEAALPRCPECGGQIDRIPFIQRTVHKFEIQIDRQNGEILAGSEHYDTLEEEPDWTESHQIEGNIGGRGGKLAVQCADGHSFTTDRLTYRYDWKIGEPRWDLLPVGSAS